MILCRHLRVLCVLCIISTYHSGFSAALGSNLISVLTLNKVSSSVKAGNGLVYKGCSNSAESLEPLTTAFFRVESRVACLFSSPVNCSNLFKASDLSPTVIFSSEWEDRFEFGSLLKSWSILSVCLLGQPDSDPGLARCLAQFCGSSLGVCEHEHALLLRLSSFGNKSIIMCIEQAIRNTIRIKTRNFLKRIIFRVSCSRNDLFGMARIKVSKRTTSPTVHKTRAPNFMRRTHGTFSFSFASLRAEMGIYLAKRSSTSMRNNNPVIYVRSRLNSSRAVSWRDARTISDTIAHSLF